MRICSSIRAFFVFVCAIVLLFAAQPLLADVVVMTNGDRFSGTVVKLEDGKLTLKLDYSDPVALAWDKVASITTTQAIVLAMANQNLMVTSIERTPDGMLVTAASGKQTLPVADVKVLRSPADQQAYEASLHPNWTRPWAGTVNVNFALARGNSQLATFGTGLNLARQTHADKTILYLSSLYSRNAGITTANTTAGGARYDHDLNPKTFVFVTGDFSSNGLQNLDLRSIVGGGFGWMRSQRRGRRWISWAAWCGHTKSIRQLPRTASPHWTWASSLRASWERRVSSPSRRSSTRTCRSPETISSRSIPLSARRYGRHSAGRPRSATGIRRFRRQGRRRTTSS
jgi:hypothetical protein